MTRRKVMLANENTQTHCKIQANRYIFHDIGGPHAFTRVALLSECQGRAVR